MGNNPFSDQAGLQRVDVADLEPGLYVAELDRPWLDTPFIVQGFTLTQYSEIQQLAEYCEYVWVDFKRSLGKHQQVGGAGGLGGDLSRVLQSAAVNTPLPEATIARHSTSIYIEHPVARQVYVDASQNIQSIFTQARLMGGVDLPLARAVIRDLVESMQRNRDALLWMLRLQPTHGHKTQHALNSAILMVSLAQYLKLSEPEWEIAGLCGLLHDIGQVKLPAKLFKNPEPPNDAERQMMQLHCEAGHQLLNNCEELSELVINSAFSHHERIDGTGYPEGRKAAELDRFTRMVSVVDAYSIMTTDQHYAKAKTPKAALKEIYQQRNKQFDPVLAINFVNMMGPYPPGTLVQLQDLTTAVILNCPASPKQLPQANVVLDRHGTEVEPKRVQLLRPDAPGAEPDRVIKKVVLAGANPNLYLENFSILPMMDPAFAG